MKSKFDWDQFRDDVTKLRFKALGVIIVLLIIAFAISLITGKDLLSSDENSGSSTAITAENTEAYPETETNHTETDASNKTSSATQKAADTKETSTAVSTESEYVSYRFRSKSQLNQHFDKHGGEFKKDFGYKNAAEYEKGASDVINNPKALCKTEKEDGDYVYYIEETNEFVVLSTDGYIRTYFRPNAGIDYFNRQ